MAAINHTKVSLRFYGDDLDPRELSARLGATPTHAVAKDETWLTASGLERIARTGSWRLRIEADDSSDEFSELVARLFEQTTSDHDTWRDLSSRFRGNLFVGLFLAEPNEGLVIPPALASEIGARGLEIGLDIYGPAGDGPKPPRSTNLNAG